MSSDTPGSRGRGAEGSCRGVVPGGASWPVLSAAPARSPLRGSLDRPTASAPPQRLGPLQPEGAPPRGRKADAPVPIPPGAAGRGVALSQRLAAPRWGSLAALLPAETWPAAPRSPAAPSMTLPLLPRRREPSPEKASSQPGLPGLRWGTAAGEGRRFFRSCLRGAPLARSRGGLCPPRLVP